MKSTATGMLAALALLVGAGCGTSDGADGSDVTTTAAVTTTTAMVGTLTALSAVLPGQCFDELPDPTQQPFAVLVIPCEDPHTFEVFAQTKIDLGAAAPAGGGYPGELAVANAAEAQCFAGFTPFMGSQWEASIYDIQTWWPSEQSWTEDRDRSIICAVYRVTGGRNKGSVRGSGK